MEMTPSADEKKMSTKERIRQYLQTRQKSYEERFPSSYCYRHHPDREPCNSDDHQLRVQKLLTTLCPEEHQVTKDVWEVFRQGSGTQRSLILRGLLDMCCITQLSEVSAVIRDLVRIDFIKALPIELSFKILQYLDAKSVVLASMVSKTWKQIADDEVVWHHLCTQHIAKKCTTCGWGLPMLERKRLKKSAAAIESRLNALKATNSPMLAPQRHAKRQKLEARSGADDDIDSDVASDVLTLPPTKPWKSVYIERYKVENNWRMGRQRVTDFAHSSSVLSLQFDDHYLITGTFDGNIHIWDVETGEHVRTLKGHIHAVSALKFDGTKLISGSWDQSVRVWNYHTGKGLCTFKGHDSKVNCVDFDKNLISCGNADSTIKIWDFDDKSCYTLRGHTGPIHSVKVYADTNTLYTSSADLTVRMWNLKTKQCIKIFGGPEVGTQGHVAQIQQALPIRLEHLEGEDHDPEITKELAQEAEGETTSSGTPNYLLTASLDNTIKLWHIKTGKCARTLFGHVEGVWCIAADQFRIVSGAHDKQVKIWDLQSGKCWHTFSAHTRPVCCVGLTDTKFASGGDDGLVKLHNFDI